MNKTTRQIERGDFQTPKELVQRMVNLLLEKPFRPDMVIEPTCGRGEILFSAYESMRPKKAIGVEIDPEHINMLSSQIKSNQNIKIINADIFLSLNALIHEVKDDSLILLIGNPPWVTNSKISSLGGDNLPEKKNLKKYRGMEAITGKSNFDIAEYILIQLIEIFKPYRTFFAFLCKTAVARNILKYCWENSICYYESSLYPIDAMKYFGAAVDACFFIIDFTQKQVNRTCFVYTSIENQTLVKRHGYFQKKIIVDIDTFQLHPYLGISPYIWRNGIKHDCSKVMELQITEKGLLNGYGEWVDIEEDLLFPLLKSSDLSKETTEMKKKVIVTQKSIGANTLSIRERYPKTWDYLQRYKTDFEARKSMIYKNKPMFSIFSIGDYSFKPYKIAISSLYKKLMFKVLCPDDQKPIMVDDTCNFIACDTETEARFVHALLTGDEVTAFLNAMIFWDSKRPITTEVLNSINLKKVAEKLGLLDSYNQLVSRHNTTTENYILQGSLFDSLP